MSHPLLIHDLVETEAELGCGGLVRSAVMGALATVDNATWAGKQL